MKASRSFIPAFSLFVALASGVPVSPSAAADATADARSGYQQAVDLYVQAATTETAAVRQELEANQDKPSQEAYDELRPTLEKCEDLLSQLKDAPQPRFDPLKARYESARAELLKKLAEARSGG